MKFEKICGDFIFRSSSTFENLSQQQAFRCPVTGSLVLTVPVGRILFTSDVGTGSVPVIMLSVVLPEL
jgi:hypothetical protein